MINVSNDIEGPKYDAWFKVYRYPDGTLVPPEEVKGYDKACPLCYSPAKRISHPSQREYCQCITCNTFF